MRPPAFGTCDRRCCPRLRSKRSAKILMRASCGFAAAPSRPNSGRSPAFAPDLLVIAPFQHSFFDEICLSKLPRRLRVAGFRSADAFWGTLANTAPQELAQRFAMCVEVAAEIPGAGKESIAGLGDPGISSSEKAPPDRSTTGSNRRGALCSSATRHRRRRILGRLRRFASRFGNQGLGRSELDCGSWPDRVGNPGSFDISGQRGGGAFD